MVIKNVIALSVLTSALSFTAGSLMAADQDRDRDRLKDQDQTQDRDRLKDKDKTLDQDRLRDQDRIYGSQLMTEQERTRYRAQVSAAKTGQEREQIRNEYHERMKVRAKERGVNLPDEPPARGNGMGSGGGMGPAGAGAGAGAGSGRR